MCTSCVASILLTPDYTPVTINCVSCFNAGHIFVDIFMIMRRTVMKSGMNIEAKHTNDV